MKQLGLGLNAWHFGMKAHAGVDAQSGPLHNVVGTAARGNDVTLAGALLHCEEEEAFAVAGHQGAHRRPEARAPGWHVARRPSLRRELNPLIKHAIEPTERTGALRLRARRRARRWATFVAFESSTVLSAARGGDPGRIARNSWPLEECLVARTAVSGTGVVNRAPMPSTPFTVENAQPAARGASSTPGSTRPASPPARVCSNARPHEGIWVFAAASFVVGASLVGLALWLWSRARRCRHWPSVPGQILESRIDDGRLETTKPVVRYRYEVAGHAYVGFRVAYAGHGSSRRAMEDLIRPYPAGSLVAVHHDPRNPAVAVLDVAARSDWLYWLSYGVAFLLLGAYLAG